jgi:hypothetical protein
VAISSILMLSLMMISIAVMPSNAEGMCFVLPSPSDSSAEKLTKDLSRDRCLDREAAANEAGADGLERSTQEEAARKSDERQTYIIAGAILIVGLVGVVSISNAVRNR